MTHLKLNNPRKKPPTRMASNSIEQDKAGLLGFFESINDTFKKTGSTWIKTSLSGVPAEFEEPLRKALDNAEREIRDKMPKLTLVKR
jgi:hypothetical protein